MAEIFIARPGCLTEQDKKMLRKAGVVVVEANHEDVKFIRSSAEVDSSDMLKIAMKAMNIRTGSYGNDQRDAFVRLLNAHLNPAPDSGATHDR